jgi:membrane protease YdiL (CAAX protease family)
MSSTPQTWSKNKALIVYFLIAYAVSWIIEIPLALQAQRVVTWSIPNSVHYLASFGPLIAALITTWLSEGRAGLRDIVLRIFKYRVPFVWWLAALSPLVAYFPLAVAISASQPDWLRLSPLGTVDFLPPLGLGAFVLWTVTFGLGEETGWRGFALPRLQARSNALVSSIILWVLWALWHLPAFFYLYDPRIAAGFLLGVLAGTITLTWLYNSASGSILIVAVWHGLFNYTTGCSQCKTGSVSAILSTLVMVWAVLIVIIFKPANLSPSQRQIE